MLDTDPTTQFEELKKGVLEQIEKTFPIADKRSGIEVRARDLRIKDDLHIDDIASQAAARNAGKNWTVPVSGTLEFVDAATGKTLLSKANHTFVQLPKLTRHSTYILGGSEKTIQNQWRLRPGPYVKATQKPGEFEAQFQLAKGKPFDIQMEPETGKLLMVIGTRSVPLYSVLHGLGVDDETMQKSWGDRLFGVSKAKANVDKNLRSFYSGWKGGTLEEGVDPKEALKAALAETRMDPVIARANLGVEHDHVSAEVLLGASKKLLDVAAGRDRPDPIDSLRYKELWSAGDMFKDRIAKSSGDIQMRIARTLAKPKLRQRLADNDPTVAREIVSPMLFQSPIAHVFSTTLASNGKQLNPLSLLSDRSSVTIMGPGGMTNANQVQSSNTAVEPSHLGFVDPVFTPESEPGKVTHLAAGIRVKDRRPMARLFNVRTGKVEDVDAARAASSNVVLPDQVVWKNGTPHPAGSKIRMADTHGDMRDDLPWAKADYVIPNAAQVFATESNLVPFMANDSAGRTTMSARHMGQAISIVGREAPLVQVEAGGGHSFEKILGSTFLAHKAKVDGTVSSVRPGEVVIKDAQGKLHATPLYDHYPLNHDKSMLHSTPTVKVGDKVNAGDLVAEHNFSRGDTLALGTNLRVAYLADGYNHEDGITISQSAAKKLGSEHLYKPSMLVSDNHVVDRKKFLVAKPTTYHPEQIKNIDDDGVIRVGAKVRPGDPLILALSNSKRAVSVGDSRQISRKLQSDFSNSAMVWDSDYDGEVVRVNRKGDVLEVHVKTKEPAQVGSKLSTRHSAKGIVTCYDEETEFLTSRGWIYGRDLTKNDVLATVNPASLHFEWQLPSVLHVFPYYGHLYKIETKNVDMLVTPDHRMFYSQQFSESGRSVLAGSSWRIDVAQNIAGHPVRYLAAAGGWVGVPLPSRIDISYAARKGAGNSLTTVPGSLWAEFMGWFLSEGSTYYIKSRRGYVVEIAQSAEANPIKYEEIRALLTKMGLRFKARGNSFEIQHRGLYERLAPLGKANEKHVPRELLDAPVEDLRTFLVAYTKGDGAADSGRIGTTSRRMAGDLQEVMFKLGIATVIRTVRRAHDKWSDLYLLSQKVNPSPLVNTTDATRELAVEAWVPYSGSVYCCTVPNGLLVVRRNGKAVVSGNCIKADDEMPHDDKGKHVEMLINSVGVPGRMNPGQVLETVAGKIAEKTGKPYLIKNFDNKDAITKVEGELKAHGLKATEMLIDPATGRRLGEVTVGPHYVFQLEHQIDKKTHVRSGGVFSMLKGAGVPVLGYDTDTQTPKGGGHHGAQSLGLLGSYSAIAVGMRDNLREMQTLKSDMNQAQELWGALSNGSALPAPKIPFAYRKFEETLRALGVNVEKNGAEVRLLPSTDQETRKRSLGEIKKPTMAFKATEHGEQPAKDGLFDRAITGGPSGAHWSHIELVEPMPHPIHAKNIARFLGVKATDIPKIVSGEVTLPNGQIGGAAIKAALAKIDVNKELAKLKATIADPKTRGADLDSANRAYKSLAVLQETGKAPQDAWTIQAVPVLPPVFRPQATLPDGTQKVNPINTLYRRLGMVNDAIKSGGKIVPYNATLEARAGLYQELQNLFGTVPKSKKAFDLDVRGTREDKSKQLPGILHMISGDKPKDGFFQDKLLGKKQDYTARITIVADPTLSADELEMPKKVALELYRPMVARRLQDLYPSKNALQIHEMISKKDPVAVKTLERELETRPVLLKRDPVLHQYGLVGQRVKLTDHAAVKVSPLILPPIGGDIDGDAVVLSVPITQGAIEEVKRIMPSNRAISGSSGDVLFKPANEAALSLYRMSIGRGEKGSFANVAEAEKAFLANKIDLNHIITLHGVGKTTLGRARIAAVVPQEFKADVLTNLEKPFDKGYQDRVLKTVARHSPGEFLHVADGLSRLGFKMAYESGHSVTLADLKPLASVRDAIIAKADKEASKQDPEAATKTWLDATKKIHTAYEEHYKTNPNNVSDMATAGIKAKKEQFQGLVMAPMLVENHLGQPSRVPITKSFAEGIDVGGYFLQAAGARRGLEQKTQSVREPGYVTKQLIWATIDQPITSKDCATTHGVLLSTRDKDVVDRYLAQPVTLAGTTYAAGTSVTPEMLTAAERGKVDKLLVRSTLKCRMPQGVCSKCMGLHPSGKEYNLHDNVGVIAAQALGERAAQLMLKQTHGGGIVSIKGALTDDFNKVESLLHAEKPSTESAILAPSEGRVAKVEKSHRGGWDIHVEGRKEPLYSRQQPNANVRAGYSFTKGEQLTAGDPNVHHILATQGLDAVQNHLTKEIGAIYGREGVLRRHVELVVRNATGGVRITDPGDHPHYIRGDYVTKPLLDEVNRTVLHGKKPIHYEPVLKPIQQIPNYLQQDWMARLQAENLTDSVVRAVQQGQRSSTRGLHPIPGIVQGSVVH